MPKQPRRQPTPASFDELPLGTCYVAVGGYGTVEILARHARTGRGPTVALALPYHTPATPAECLLQAIDCLVIRDTRGTIAEIPVQAIIERAGFAGFRLLESQPVAAPASSADGLRAFEQFLAGVSARAMNAQESQARDAGWRG